MRGFTDSLDCPTLSTRVNHPLTWGFTIVTPAPPEVAVTEVVVGFFAQARAGRAPWAHTQEIEAGAMKVRSYASPSDRTRAALCRVLLDPLHPGGHRLESGAP